MIANICSSPVPISVVWCVFEALASAACLMKNGDLPGENREDWDTIYHRDIKLLNSMSPLTWNDRMELTRFIVFLDFPDQNVWKNIPVPRVRLSILKMSGTNTQSSLQILE